ncbi:hypothetical protein [Saccharopolyspora tripterygii]
MTATKQAETSKTSTAGRSTSEPEHDQSLQELRQETMRLAKRWRMQAVPLVGMAATHAAGAAAAELDGPEALLPILAGWGGAGGAYAYAHGHTGWQGRVYVGIAAVASAMFQAGIGVAGGKSVAAALMYGVGCLISLPWWVRHSEKDPDVTAEFHAPSDTAAARASDAGSTDEAPSSPVELDPRQVVWKTYIGANGKTQGSSINELSDFAYGWKATVQQPIGGHWEDVFQERKLIHSVYDLPDKRVFIESIPGVSVRQARMTVLTSDPLQATTRWTGPGLDSATGKFKLMVTADAETLFWKLWDPGAGAKHGLVSGITRSGKTKVLDLILTECSMSDRVEPLVIDGGGGASLPQWIGRVKMFAKTRADAKKVLRYALDRMDARRPILERQGGGSLEPTPGMPLIPVIIDEAHKRLMSDDEVDNRDIVRMCERIGQEGAKFGVCLILATQAPTAKQLGNSTVLRDQVKSGTIVGLRTMEKGNEGMISTGDPMPEALRDLPSEFPNGAATHGLGYMMTSRKIRARALLLENPKDWPVVEVEHEPEAADIPLPRMGVVDEPEETPETQPGSTTASADDLVAQALGDGCAKNPVAVMQATGLSMKQARDALKAF